MKGSKVLRRVPKPSIRLEAASGAELAVTNACVMEIVLGGTTGILCGLTAASRTRLQTVCEYDSPASRSPSPSPWPLWGRNPPTAGANFWLQWSKCSLKSRKPTLSAILEQFSDVLATSDEDLGRTSVIRHAIHTGDAKPVRCSPRHIAYHQRAQVETLLNEMIHRDIIEPSCSTWASPIMLQKDAHPLPRIDDTLDALSGAQWFSTLDLASGYWQVEMETRDREKTAFTTPYGLYQFKVMPFGLCNAPATFQRLMETSLRGLVGSKCLVYLDDVIVFGRTAEEHTARLQEVLDRLRKVGLKVKPEKCQLMKRKVAYLGHIISEKGIATDPSKTRAVKEWQAPSCVSELRQFLGLASYYRKFVNGFASIAAPLHRLLEGDAEWKWTEDCQVAFDALKHQLTSAPILAYPDFRRRFLVDVDASGDGLGAVLSQKDGNKERVMAYASRSLTKPERRYCVTRREMLGLVWALREFRPYLYGQRFLVRTDHSCLRWLRNFKEPEGQDAFMAMLTRCQCCAQCGRPMKGSMCAVRAAPSGSAAVAQTLRDQLLAAQQADPEIQLLRQLVTSGSWPTQCPHEYSRYLNMMWQQGQIWIVQEDLICRHRDGLTAEEGATQVLLSRALRSEIMTTSRFYWPGMSGDVHLWCSMCTQCAARKRPSKNSRALMQPMTAGYPLQRVGMDILGPLEKTPSGNRYALVLTDYFTKWTAAFPLTNMEADTVAKVLMEKYIAYFGAPDCLHSDQGRSFEARVVQ
ncbi:Retrovirus-related Pol polyprotein from transposon 17.6 [Trichinella sp. T6]|nr:Retrovirus-related Pol polyprotein from transposon 17.6 [Trichinella sp. T6]